MPLAVHYFKLILGVIAISFSATLVKLVPGLPPTASAFYRTFYSTLILLLISLARRRSEFQTNNLRWLWPSIGAGVFLAADLIIWHKTIFYIGSGPATLLGNSQIIFVAVYAFLFFKEKFSPLFLVFLPLIFTGLYLAIPKSQIMVSPQMGFILGLVVGLTYAGFLICLHYAKARTGLGYPEIFSLACIMAVTSVFIGLYAVFFEKVSLGVPGWHDQGVLFLMALVPQSLGWILIKSNLTQLPSHQGSLLLLIQPVLTVVWGGLLFSEPLSALQTCGMLLALFSLGLYQFRFAPQP
jgi:drug/metabolite transporter (DMT)-like permease